MTADSRLSLRNLEFQRSLAALALIGLIIRIIYVLTAPKHLGGDAKYFHAQANLIAHGHGYINPFAPAKAVPSAAHPPLFPLMLSVASRFGLSSVTAHRLVGVACGVGTVVVIGVVARRLAGPSAGLIAAALATVYPAFIATDATLMSESLFGLLTAVVIWELYRLRDAPTPGRATELGMVIALAALTRGEAVLLVPLAMGSAALAGGPVDVGTRLVRGLSVLLAFSLVISPWALYNSSRFQRPVPISTNGDVIVANTNCDTTWSGPLMGFWSLKCYSTSGAGDESVRAVRARQQGLRYVRGHLSRLPIVVAARLGRFFEVFRPSQGARLATLEGKRYVVSRLTTLFFAALVALDIVGIRLLRNRKIDLVPVVMIAGVAVTTAAAAYGSVRLRASFDVALIILGGVTIQTLIGPKAGVTAPPRPSHRFVSPDRGAVE